MVENKQERKYEKLENGDFKGTTIYPETEVSIKLEGKDIVIGKQPSYKAEQIIFKSDIPFLKRYLLEQYTELMDRINKGTEVLKELEYVDVDSLKGFVDKLPKEKLQHSKKLQEVNELVKKYEMKISTTSHLKYLKDQIKFFQEQLDFINKMI